MISLIHPWYNKERNTFTVKDNSNRWEVDVLHKIPDSEVKKPSVHRTELVEIITKLKLPTVHLVLW